MKEFSITLRKDGSAVLTKSKYVWNEEHGYTKTSLDDLENKPFLFEVHQKVVDVFGNTVTIKEIIKNKPPKAGACPEWFLLVEENENCYRYTEIAGIYVRDISAEELKHLINQDALANISKQLEKLMKENAEKSDGSEFYGGRASAFGVVHSLITSMLYNEK